MSISTTCPACQGSGVTGWTGSRTCSACDGIGATPDQIAAWRAQYRACEQCGAGFLPAADELRCERCRCQTCGDLPYSYVEGDREIGDCCPECGRGDEEP